jgi:hypothetical protein
MKAYPSPCARDVSLEQVSRLSQSFYSVTVDMSAVPA